MDESRDKFRRLREQEERHIHDLDRLLSAARGRREPCDEEDIDYRLHPALHLLLGAISNIDQRMINLEDMVLRLAESAALSPKARAPVAYETNQDRQDFEAGMAGLRGEVELLRHMADLDRPVTAADRANIAMELLRMLDRFIHIENELRAQRGEPMIPTRDTWTSE
jgi:hypothetical protein